MYASDLYTQDFDAVLEFMKRDLRIDRVNSFQFLSQLPLAGIDQALVREKGECVVVR